MPVITHTLLNPIAFEHPQGFGSLWLCYFSCLSPHTTKASRPSLGFLKKGLSKFVANVKKCKDDLTARLKKAEKIFDADAAWLEDAANHVDEETVIDKLENMSVYERGFACLDERLVNKLKELAGGVGQKVTEIVASNKRKSSPLRGRARYLAFVLGWTSFLEKGDRRMSDSFKRDNSGAGPLIVRWGGSPRWHRVSCSARNNREAAPEVQMWVEDLEL
ncbi:hypothetical protein B0H17DRAFT_1144521 [Mycena rosella]|uniref:Uncharacterized protein n=1 Tax=Mycena rosella TaxID=1033263 RepID=A0AAD7G5L1_MYCRO|nr:hypothetical protein B0H17DRAFT_1144521 [Mycena rosella]